MKNKNEIQEYLLRVSLTGAFSGTPDNLIDQITTSINTLGDFMLSEIYTIIKNNGRNLEISSDTILNLKYGQDEIHLLFNLWYGFNYQPSFQGNKPQIDHIFPQTILKKIKVENPKTGRKDLRKYYKENIDQIGNLMLLTAIENGAGGKGEIPPEEWFKNKSDDYLNLHLIPKEQELWKLENFEKFVGERNKLIIDKFKDIIIKG